MKTLFHIGDQEAGSILLCELGHDHTCLATADGNGEIRSIRYFDTASLAVLEDDVDLKKYEKIVVGSAYPEAVVIPRKLFDEQKNNDWLNALYPSAHEEIYTTQIPEWQTVIGYRLPKEIADRFSNAVHAHVYLCDLKSSFQYGDGIKVSFSPKFFRVLVKKGNALQLCQMYPYATPLDVVYYLLNICYKFQLSQETTHLALSGLIDEDSHLYKELHQYFLDIAFEKAAGLPDMNYPAHYFNSIQQLATCVS